jgi:hypothetical protein
MQNDAETRIKQDLLVEIHNLEQNYQVIKGFISGKDYDVAVLGNSIQSFKDSLSRASAFVLALYNLKGKRVNIPWDPLFTSLDYAVATLTSAPKREAVVAILSMADPQIQQVMSYFAALKKIHQTHKRALNEPSPFTESKES